MKSLFITATIALLSSGLGTTAWADTPTGNASQLMTTEVQTVETTENNTGQLETLANQINQTISNDQSQDDTKSAPLLDDFELPDGLVIRGSSLGGVTVGTEL